MGTSLVRRCEVCRGDRFRTLYPVADRNQDVPGTWMIVACEDCGLGRLDPMPAPDRIGEFYRDVFYADGGQRFRPWMERLRRWAGRLRGHRLRALTPLGGRLLDFGAGSGHFAAAQRAQGWDAVAVDPYSNAAGLEAGAHIEGGRVSLNCADGAYDAITLWYVIEHLPDPRGAVREFRRALRPGGILVLAQQDFSSVQARLFRERWLILDPPRHLFQFSRSNLSRLVEEEGFTVRHVSAASLELGPFTILQSLLNCIVGNQNYLFCYLKNRRVVGQAGGPGQRRGRLSPPVLLSLLLTPLLGPFALACYLVLLPFGSGDVFTLYLERDAARTGESA
jgi:SAM-dependent methyltransferase